MVAWYRLALRAYTFGNCWWVNANALYTYTHVHVYISDHCGQLQNIRPVVLKRIIIGWSTENVYLWQLLMSECQRIIYIHTCTCIYFRPLWPITKHPTSGIKTNYHWMKYGECIFVAIVDGWMPTHYIHTHMYMYIFPTTVANYKAYHQWYYELSYHIKLNTLHMSWY